jgi:hypothetical protein
MINNAIFLLLLITVTSNTYSINCTNHSLNIISTCEISLCEYRENCDGDVKVYLCPSISENVCPSYDKCIAGKIDIETEVGSINDLQLYFEGQDHVPDDELIKIFTRYSGLVTSETEEVDKIQDIESTELFALPPVMELVRRGLIWARVYGPVYAREAWRAVRGKIKKATAKKAYEYAKKWALEQEKNAKNMLNERRERELKRREGLEKGRRLNQKERLENMLNDRRFRDLENEYKQEAQKLVDRDRRNGRDVNLKQLRKELEDVRKDYERDLQKLEQNLLADKLREAQKEQQQRQPQKQRQDQQKQAENQRREQQRRDQQKQAENQRREQQRQDQQKQAENQRREQQRQQQRQQQQRQNENQRREQEKKAEQQREQQRKEQQRQAEQQRKEQQRQAQEQKKRQEEQQRQLARPQLPPWFDLYKTFEPQTLEELKKLERENFDF